MSKVKLRFACEHLNPNSSLSKKGKGSQFEHITTSSRFLDERVKGCGLFCLSTI